MNHYRRSYASLYLFIQLAKLFLGCPNDWIQHQAECYRTLSIPNGVNSSDARRQCAQVNGALISIHSYRENQFVLNLTEETILNAKYVRNISWVWLDGSAWDYRYWAPGEPGEGGCLTMSEDGSWRSQHCAEKIKKFVCKLKSGMVLFSRDCIKNESLWNVQWSLLSRMGLHFWVHCDF